MSIRNALIFTAMILLFACGSGDEGQDTDSPLFSEGLTQWIQSDWSGGIGPSVTNQYSAATDIDTMTANQFTLASMADWFDVDWKYRRSITVTNSGGAQTDYQVRLVITYLSGMQADFSDLRFTNQSGAELDYWIQDKTDSVEAVVWVEVDSLAGSGDTAIYMYYGNASAVSASSGEDTFIFFDGFDGATIDPAKWTVVDPNNEISVTGGKLRFERLINGSWNKGVYGNATYPRSDISFEFDYQWMVNNPDYDAIMVGWHDSGTGISYPNLVYAYYNPGSGGSSTVNATVYEDGNHRSGVIGSWTVTTDYDVRVRMRASGGAYYEQSEDGGDTWLTSYTSTYSTESDLRAAWSFYSGTHEYDNARIRKWMDTEPTSSFGTIEERYLQSGTLTSNVFETHAEGSIWGVLSYTTGGSGTVEVKVRTSNDPTMSDAPSFNLCAVVPSNTDLVNTNCVQDGNRYIQYFVRLTGSEAETPVFQSISIMFDNADVVANAGPDRTMARGKSIIIDGSASAGKDLEYNWTIIKGDGALDGIQTSTPTYTVGAQAADQDVEIELTVRNVLGELESDMMVVHVIGEKPAVEDKSGVGGNIGETVVYKEKQGNKIVLLAGDVELVLPEGALEFTLAETSQNQMVAGVPDADGNTGRVYLVTQPVSDIAAIAVDAAPFESKQSGDAGVIEVFGNQSGDRFGEYLGVGDVNDDGVEEVLVGAPGAGDYGKIYIYDLELSLIGVLVGTVDYPLSSLFIGNYLAVSFNSVVFGPQNPAQNSVLSLYPLSEVELIDYAFMLASNQYFEGISVIDSTVVDATAGTGSKYQTVHLANVVGDGTRDLIMGSNEGRIYIYFDQQTVGTNITTAEADILISEGTGADLFGYTIAVGDVSGDGLVDLVIGAPAYGANREGAIFVVFGMDVWETSIDIMTSGYVLSLIGSSADGTIGKELLLADVNDDGVDEIYTIRGADTTVRFDLTGTIQPVTGGCSIQVFETRFKSIWILLLLFLSAAALMRRTRKGFF